MVPLTEDTRSIPKMDLYKENIIPICDKINSKLSVIIGPVNYSKNAKRMRDFF